jgi:hypothetical protein
MYQSLTSATKDYSALKDDYIFPQTDSVTPNSNDSNCLNKTSHVPDILGLVLVAFFLTCMSVCIWIYWRDNIRDRQLKRRKDLPISFEEQGRNECGDSRGEEPPPAYSL